jgi:hypothetical protein
MGHDLIVHPHVEGDEAPKRCRIVEIVQLQPRVPQGSPKSFDHGVGEAHFDLRRDTARFLALEQSVDVLRRKGHIRENKHLKSQSRVVERKPRKPPGEFTVTTVCPQTSSTEAASLQTWVFGADIHQLRARSSWG